MTFNLNLGCGEDVRKGWINLDRVAGPGIEQWDLANGLPTRVTPESVKEIVAIDILEHLHHWEALRLLRVCHRCLGLGGRMTIQVPNVISVFHSSLPVEKKLAWIYGGQDIPQGKSECMERARKAEPKCFCHRWGWSVKTLTDDLHEAGFSRVVLTNSGFNMIAEAWK